MITTEKQFETDIESFLISAEGAYTKPTDPQTLPVPSEPATNEGEQPEAEVPAETPETEK